MRPNDSATHSIPLILVHLVANWGRTRSSERIQPPDSSYILQEATSE